MQLITNDKFKSVEHRVLANQVGPRISAACFFYNGHKLSSRLYGPIKELLSEDNPPKYRETTIGDYAVYSPAAKRLGCTSVLSHYKIWTKQCGGKKYLIKFHISSIGVFVVV